MNTGTFAWHVIKRMAGELQAQQVGLSEAEAIVKVADSAPGQFWYRTLKGAQPRGDRIEYTPSSPVTKRADTSPRAQAYAAIQKAAAEIRARAPGLSEADAITHVVTENPTLYARYRQAARS